MKTMLALIACTQLLTGCATTQGLQVSAEDSAECAAVGFTPWTERQKGTI